MSRAPRPLSPGWMLATAAVLGLAALAASPPLVGAEMGAVVRHAFSVVCHQIPGRTPHLGGEPLALCHRCTGMIGGLALGLLVAPVLSGRRLTTISTSTQARWLVIAAVPTALDWLTGAVGIWTNTPLSRTVTGAVFGVVAGLVLAANLLTATRQRPTPSLHPSP